MLENLVHSVKYRLNKDYRYKYDCAVANKKHEEEVNSLVHMLETGPRRRRFTSSFDPRVVEPFKQKFQEYLPKSVDNLMVYYAIETQTYIVQFYERDESATLPQSVNSYVLSSVDRTPHKLVMAVYERA